MRVATIGSDSMLAVRRHVLEETAGIVLVGLAPDQRLGEALTNVDILFIGVSGADRFRYAAEAARSGTHVFVEWPPASSIRECSALVRLAEESGLECGVSRPLRFAPFMESIDEGWRANVVSLALHGNLGMSDSFVSYPRLSRLMADAVDLSCALVKSSSVRRVDAEVARDESSHPEAALFSLRFHSGAYAHAFIRLNGVPTMPAVYAGGSGARVEGTINELETGIRRETAAFVAAVADDRPVPVSALDALHTMRIVERLQGLLR